MKFLHTDPSIIGYASQVYNEFKQDSVESYLTTSDMRVALLMSNTTCDTENDAIVNVADFTTLDRSDAAGYADVALTTKQVNKDDTNDRAQFDADDVVFTGLGGDATRDYVGALLYKFVTNDAASIVSAFVEFAAPVSGTVTELTVSIPNGLLRFT